MKKQALFLSFLILANTSFSQHFGGIFFSIDKIPTGKNSLVIPKTGDYLEDHEFSPGYSIGYQGLLMENRRFSFTYGVQYTFRSSVLNQFNGYVGCAVGNDLTIPILNKEEEWKLIEVPVGARYNILKSSKWQPYVSMAIVVNYPLFGNERRYVEQSGEIYYEWEVKPKRIDGAFEFGVGLNYKAKNYIFNVQPSFRPIDGYAKLGVGFAVLRKF